VREIFGAIILAAMAGIPLALVGLTTSHASEPDLHLREARAWPVSCDSSSIPQETLSLNARARGDDT
jgi:hypothetical protein